MQRFKIIDSLVSNGYSGGWPEHLYHVYVLPIDNSDIKIDVESAL